MRHSSRARQAARPSIVPFGLAQLSARLSGLSPLGVLERGFGLVLDDNRSIIRSVSAVEAGARINVRLSGGELICRVEEVKPRDGDGP